MRGPIAADELGPTLMHEHIFVLTTEIQQNYDTEFDPTVEVPRAAERLEELHEKGIRTIVDLTVVGLGRDVELIRRVAERTRVNVVVATGLYTYAELPHFFDHRGGPGTLLGGEEPMVEMFVKDLTEGIKGTGVRAGILKCATDEPGLTPGVERVLRACAQAHLQTGAPISTHTHAGTRRGLDQLRVFEEEGVDLRKVVIGHCGDTTDLGYLEELLSAGVTLGMDRFGLDILLPFEERVRVVAELCERGWSGQLVLSHDTSCHIDWMAPDTRRLLPRWNFTHISDEVLPALRDRGVTEDQIHQMLVDNPARILDVPAD